MPDILISRGHNRGLFPMTGIAFTRKLKSFFDAHRYPLCTFGGHDVGCRVACAAMDVYERTRPWQNALLAEICFAIVFSISHDNNPGHPVGKRTGLLLSRRSPTSHMQMISVSWRRSTGFRHAGRLRKTAWCSGPRSRWASTKWRVSPGRFTGRGEL